MIFIYFKFVISEFTSQPFRHAYMAEALLPMVERYSSLGCLGMVEFGCVDIARIAIV